MTKRLSRELARFQFCESDPLVSASVALVAESAYCHDDDFQADG